jgi:hypothetical protein
MTCYSLAFSEDFGAFHFGYVFEVYLDQLACFFKVVGDFDVVVVGGSLKHGLLDVNVYFYGFRDLVVLQRSFEMPRIMEANYAQE